MKKARISLDSVDKVKEFVHVASELDCDLDLQCGKQIIDGKSIMGIFSLDLTKPIEMKIITKNDSDYIINAFKDFIIME